MKKLGLLLLSFIAFFTFNVKADTCSSEEMKSLKDLANKIELNYEYEIKEKDGVKYAEYSITATNLNEDLKAMIIEDYYMDKYQEFKYSNTKTATLKGFSDGERVMVTIKAYTADACSSKTVTTKTVKLPYYNQFYDEEVCNSYPDFKYCKQFLEEKLSFETYQSEFEKYTSKEEETLPTVENDITVYIYIGVGVAAIILIIVILVVFIKKRKEKNSL